MAAAALPQPLHEAPPRISSPPDPPPTHFPDPAANPPPTLIRARELHAAGRLLNAAEAYRQALTCDPRNPSALLGLSLVARQSNQNLAALRLARAALAAAPANAVAWANYADILSALGQPSPAEAVYRRAIALDPRIAAAHYGLGNCVAAQSNYASALPCFEAAVGLAPHLADFHFAHAFALGKLGRHTDAAHAYRSALSLRPGFPSAWLNLGVELVADGRADLAAPCYGQAIATAISIGKRGHATQISARLNLGHLARSHRRYPEAQRQYELAFDVALGSPVHAASDRLTEVHIAFACLHLDRSQFPQAWHSIRSAEAPDAQAGAASSNPEIANTRGILLLAEHAATVAADPGEPHASLLEEALAAFEQAEAAGHSTAASNRGNALLRLGRCNEALAAHRATVDRHPHHAGVRYNLALTQLRMGDFAQGWRNYEIRWSFRDIHPRQRRFLQPRWKGEPLPESSVLLLYAEQGLGDTIQFIRYLTLTAQRSPGSTIAVEVQPPLLRLLHPFAEQTAAASRVKISLIPQGTSPPLITHHCPLMSLPAVFGTTLETVPAQIPYLCADHALVQQRRTELSGLLQLASPAARNPKPLTIGLNWAGNPNYRADHERSTHLKTFYPLLELPDIHWISLQKGAPARQIDELPLHLRLENLSSGDRDLADTAALIANLDLVITTDTAIAHLAGALGKPLWLLLSWQSDWRWMQDRSDTPWYPQIRLFRQSSPGDWSGLIERVAQGLSELGRSRNQGATARCSQPTAPIRCDTTKSA